jgi:LssY C-terminus
MLSARVVKFLMIALVCSLALQGATLPVGTPIDVRLTTEASSDKPSGAMVSAVVIAPVLLNGVPALNAGAQLSGKTADAAAAKTATDVGGEKPATLRIQFTKIADASGHSQALSCTLASVDNAREKVDDSGLIIGIVASQTYAGLLNTGLGKLSGQFGALLNTVKDSFLKEVDPSIDYKPGVELTIKLTKELNWTTGAPASSVAAIAPADALAALVTTEPFRTVAQNPPNPSDLTNLMFIGTEEQVRSAFKEAGWFTAAELSAISRAETARAIIENRGYSEAPMSILYLEGKPPDLTFQKQNNTFDKRHHIRIWLRPEKFNNQPVWVAAATHDIGITLSPVSHNFTHGIDPNIDAERSKVTNDLLFTGHVKAIALVDRPQVPAELSNATGDKLLSDHKLAVLEF